MRNFNTNTSNEESWLTPPWIIDFLGPFDLDPCTIENRPWDTARVHFTKKDDGLTKNWSDYHAIWLNPPYGKKTFTWIERLANHPGTGYALIFARTDTNGFYNHVWNKAVALFFFSGRIQFYKPDGTKGNQSNAPSCLITYSHECVQKLKKLDRMGKGVCIELGDSRRLNAPRDNQIPLLFP